MHTISPSIQTATCKPYLNSHQPHTLLTLLRYMLFPSRLQFALSAASDQLFAFIHHLLLRVLCITKPFSSNDYAMGRVKSLARKSSHSQDPAMSQPDKMQKSDSSDSRKKRTCDRLNALSITATSKGAGPDEIRNWPENCHPAPLQPPSAPDSTTSNSQRRRRLISLNQTSNGLQDNHNSNSSTAFRTHATADQEYTSPNKIIGTNDVVSQTPQPTDLQMVPAEHEAPVPAQAPPAQKRKGRCK